MRARAESGRRQAGGEHRDGSIASRISPPASRTTATGPRITVRLPEPLRDTHGAVVTMSASSLAEIIETLGIENDRDELFNFAVNGELIVHGENDVQLKNGDEVEIVVAFSGG